MKITYTLLLCLACISAAFAQKAYIPDPIFRAYISTISPTAITGDSMDINDPIITTIDSINITALGISDLTGIFYFDSLHAIEGGYNNISQVNSLPNRIKGHSDGYANFNHNIFSTVSTDLVTVSKVNLSYCNFSGTLSFHYGYATWKDVDISHNNLDSIHISSPFYSFDCSFNNCKSVQLYSQPSTFSRLNVSHNMFSNAAFLDFGIYAQYIDCSYNQLNALPSLHYYLRELNCSHNNISQLPILNTLLEKLNANNNKLIKLPKLQGLQEVYCDSNDVVRIDSLYFGLQKLHCRANNLLCLPVLPNTLTELRAASNSITCLNHQPTAPSFNADILYNGSGYDTCFLNSTFSCLRLGVVKGRVFADLNNNNIYDGSDYPLASQTVTTSPLNQVAVTDAQGIYTMKLYPGVNYTGIAPSTTYRPDTNSIYINQPNDTVIVDYAQRVVTQFSDVAVFITESWPSLTLDTVSYHVKLVNKGTRTESGQVQLLIGHAASYVGSSPTANGTTLPNPFWNYTNLAPGAEKTYQIWVRANNSMPNTQYSVMATGTLANIDSLPLNNKDTVFGKFAANNYPRNRKIAYPTNYSMQNYIANEYIEYTVAFQNTGTDTAGNVWIIDTLDNRFDMTSLYVVGASHPYTLTITENVLRVDFQNINLPDTGHNHILSHGFFKFLIKPDRNQPFSGPILNKAYIYFSNGLVVMTGSAAVDVCISNLKISTNKEHDLVYYECGMDSASIYVYTSGAGNNTVNYLWSNGSTNNYMYTSTSGEYFVTVTDGCGSTAVGSEIIEDVYNDPEIYALRYATPDPCDLNTGSVKVVACSNLGPVTFLWMNGSTGDSIGGLAANTYYSVLITAVNGREMVFDGVILDQTDLPLAAAPSKDVCVSTGYMNVSGGIPPYEYLWSDGTTEDHVTGMGMYYCTVTDSLGCTIVDSVEVRDITSYAGEILVSIIPVDCGSPNEILYTMNTDLYLQYNFGNGDMYAYEETGFLYAVPPGDHTLMFVANYGNTWCSIDYQLHIVNNTTPQFTINQTAEAACNDDNGELVVVLDSTAYPYPYQVTWSNGANTDINWPLSSGQYSVTVTNSESGCYNVGYQDVTLANSGIEVIEEVHASNCFPDPDGSITLTFSGGVKPYYIQWQDGSEGPIRTDMTGGYYYDYTITDNAGCGFDSFVYVPLSTVYVTWVIEPATCTQGTGATVLVSGGTPPYTYTWEMVDTTPTVLNLEPNFTYDIWVTDSTGCLGLAYVTLQQVQDTLSVSHVASTGTCSGGGSIQVTAEGGSTPYSYLWGDGSTGSSISNLTAGTYSYTVTDSSGCSKTGTAIIHSTQQALDVDSTVTNATCHGAANGTITLTVSNGVSPYTATWSNGASGLSINQLSAGSYTYTVTDDAGCTATGGLTVTQPTPLQVSTNVVNALCATGGSLTVIATGGTTPYSYAWSNGGVTSYANNLGANTYIITVTAGANCSATTSATILNTGSTISAIVQTTDVSCHGEMDGMAILTPSGGTPPYTYLWDNWDTSNVNTGLVAGMYNYTITDANGCTKNGTAHINEPVALSLSLTATDASCGLANGTATVTASGGTPPYTYLWSDGGNGTQLAPGMYTVTVKDACLGASATASVTVNNAAQGGPLGVVVSKTNLTCYGAGDGTIGLTVCGGTGNYTYTWSHGPQVATLTGLDAGTYTVDVSDGNTTITETVTLEQAAQITFSVNTTCNSFLAQVQSVQGGIGPYTYLWSTGVTGAFLTGTAASGTYSVTVTDVGSCSASASVTAAKLSNVTYPALTFTEGLCGADGTVNVASVSFPNIVWTAFNTDTVNGASETYSVLYNTSYHLSVGFTSTQGLCSKDTLIYIPQASAGLALSTINLTNPVCYGEANGSIAVDASGGATPYSYLWNGGSTNDTIENLSAGEFSVTVTDANGCTAADTFTLTVPAAMVLNAVTTNTACHGEASSSIAVGASGGTTPYSYLWNGGSTNDTIENLSAGEFSLTVTDANGCTAADTFTVTMPLAMELNVTTTDATCNGTATGTIQLNVTGGTGGYTYEWSPEVIGPGLPAGTYSATVTDANGCSISTTQTINQPVALSALATVIDESVCGAADGSIDVTLVGGTVGYAYIWSNGDTTAAINGLLADTYIVTATDANGCSVTISSEVDCITGVDKQPLLKVAIYPNPADDMVYIDVPVGDSYYVTMYDMTGRIVKQVNITQYTQLQLNDIAKGMYTVEIKAMQQNVSKVEKLVLR